MFVTVLLAAGALALEREQNTFTRLVRGPVSRAKLLAEKVVFAVAGSVPLTLLMLLAVAAFVPVEWDRFHLWLVVAVAGAAAFAAMGTLVGALAREVQTASLLAFTLLLPVAFLALVPEGVLSSALYDATRVVSALFPFDPTVDAATSALYGEGGLLGPAGAPGRARTRLRRRSPHRDLAAWLGAAVGARISCVRMSFPATRLRRLRQTSGLRGLVRETELSVGHLVYPLFVTHGEDRREPVESMPGIERLTISHLEAEAGEIAGARDPGRAAVRDPGPQGRGGFRRLRRRGNRAAGRARPEAGPAGPDRDHGRLPVRVHVTRPLRRRSRRRCGRQRRDARAARQDRHLARRSRRRRGRALGHDGRPCGRRSGRSSTPRVTRELPIVAYSAKFASAFYGPFRDAADSAPCVRGPARVPDGPGQRARGGARGEASTWRRAPTS